MSEFRAHFNDTSKKKENQEISSERLLESIGQLLYCVIKSRDYVIETKRLFNDDLLDYANKRVGEDMMSLIKDTLKNFYGAAF